MKGHYFNYEDYPQRIKYYRVIEPTEKVEITTNKRSYVFSISEIESRLMDFKPTSYNGVAQFDHIEYLRELAKEQTAEDEQITNSFETEPGSQPPIDSTVPQESEDPDNSYEKLKEEAFKMDQNHRQINNSITEKLKVLIDKINVDKPSASDLNMLRQFGSVANQIAKTEMNEIKGMMLLKDIIMPKGNIIKDKKRKKGNNNEKSDDNQKD